MDWHRLLRSLSRASTNDAIGNRTRHGRGAGRGYEGVAEPGKDAAEWTGDTDAMQSRIIARRLLA
jgi:hypothetical protein